LHKRQLINCDLTNSQIAVSYKNSDIPGSIKELVFNLARLFRPIKVSFTVQKNKLVRILNPSTRSRPFAALHRRIFAFNSHKFASQMIAKHKTKKIESHKARITHIKTSSNLHKFHFYTTSNFSFAVVYRSSRSRKVYIFGHHYCIKIFTVQAATS